MSFNFSINREFRRGRTSVLIYFVILCTLINQVVLYLRLLILSYFYGIYFLQLKLENPYT